MTSAIIEPEVILDLRFDTAKLDELAEACQMAKDYLEKFLRKNQPTLNYWADPFTMRVIVSKVVPNQTTLTFELFVEADPRVVGRIFDVKVEKFLDHTWRPVVLLNLMMAFLEQQKIVRRADFSKQHALSESGVEQ